MPSLTASTLKSLIFKEAHLALEPVILLIGGVTLLIAGVLLFPASAGVLPYYDNGLCGVLLVVLALQMITLGKTPFGELRRTKLLLAIGCMIAAAGIVTCFIPAVYWTPRVLLVLCLGPGSVYLLVQMCRRTDKLPAWLTYGGIFRHLIAGCCAVYVLSILMAFLLWNPRLMMSPVMAGAAVLAGVALMYLAGVLQTIYRRYPQAGHQPRDGVALSTEQALLLLMGMFMLLLGVLLVPVSLGRLAFSGSAQLGLLLVLFAVQMLASGSTPIGAFRRSWPIIAAGLLCAAAGVVSCLIPNLLVPALTALVGVLNILGGSSTLVKTCLPLVRPSGAARGRAAGVLAKLFAAQVLMSLLTIVFGVAMLVPGLIHGVVIGVVLAANGCVLLYLLHLLVVLDTLRAELQGAT